MNKVILSGNLCRDIELKQTQTGKSVTTNSIAVRRDYKNKEGTYDSDFIDLVAWGAQAEYLSRYAHKGDRVELVGRWEVRKYQANDGTQRTVHECIVESITAFSKQPKEQSKAEQQFVDVTDEEGLPF